jgi:hypothetical protein
VSFDDVTVSMDAPRAAQLLREASLMDDAAQAGRASGGAYDVGVEELMDDTDHDDVTKAVASSPYGAADWMPDQSESDTERPPDPDAEEPHLMGARHDDSVLFSLDAIAQNPEPAGPEDFRDEQPTTLFDAPVAASQRLAAPDPFDPAPPPVAPEPLLAPPPQAPELAPLVEPPISALAPEPKKQGGGGWIWFLLVLVLLGAAAAAGFYFREPKVLFDQLGL